MNLPNEIKKQKAILCDIDGTICDESSRKKYARKETGKTDWDKYFEKDLILREIVNEELRQRLIDYKKEGFKIVFLTGRPLNLRDVTIKFLSKNKIPIDTLVMREDPTETKDYKDIINYKSKEIKKLLKRFDFLIGFDDLDEGIEALKKNNIPYEQIAFKR